MDDLQVTRWDAPEDPTKSAILEQYTAEGMRPYQWGNGPGDVYSAHTHSFNKVLYVVEGSITFGLPELDESVTLYAGDRLDLPAGTLHDAVVGPEGVVCLEGHC